VPKNICNEVMIYFT